MCCARSRKCVLCTVHELSWKAARWWDAATTQLSNDSSVHRVQVCMDTGWPTNDDEIEAAFGDTWLAPVRCNVKIGRVSPGTARCPPPVSSATWTRGGTQPGRPLDPTALVANTPATTPF